MKSIAGMMAVVVCAALAGCALTPSSIVVQPTSVPPQPVVAAAPSSNGAIFQAGSYRPMFEDRRARLVGDVLTIRINEKTTAGKQASSSASKSGNAALNSPYWGFSAQNSVEFKDKGAVSSSNNFFGELAVTVIDVLPNGNLLVSGEKQVALDKGAEFIRFSGVVNPSTISAGNTVPSTQVADARVEYRTNSQIDPAEMAAMLTRFFLSVLPL